MKTELKSVIKDNIATAAILAATFIAIVGGVMDSTDALADQAVAQLPMQRMETIMVTASRDEAFKLDTIIVTASRDVK